MKSLLGMQFNGLRCQTILLWSFFILGLIMCHSPALGQSSKRPLTFEQLDSMLDMADPLRKQGKFADALSISIKATEYLPELGHNSDFKIRIIVNLANSLRALGATSDAIENLYKAIHINQKRNGGFNDQDAIWFGSIGSYHMSEGHIDSSIFIFKKAITIMATQNRPIYHASAYNNLGLAFSAAKQLDSATQAFATGIDLLDLSRKGHKSFSAVILENLADVEVLKHNYDLAQDLVEQGIPLLPSVGAKRPAHYSRLIAIKEKSGDFTSIPSDIDSFFALRHFLPKNIKHTYTQRVLETQKRLQLGDQTLLDQTILQYKDSMIAFLKHQNANISKGLIEYKLSTIKQQTTINELERVESEQTLQIERARIKRFQLLGVFVVVLFGTTLYILIDRVKKNRIQIDLEKKMAALEVQNRKLVEHKLAEEIERKKNDILNLALDNSKKLEWNNELISRLKGLRRTDDKDIEKTLREIEIQMGQQLQSDKQAELLKTNVDKVNQEFNDKLLLQFPSLTRLELELCGFLKLRLSGQEIASIRNVDPKSITKAKQRLKKKMNLQSGDDLYRFLNKI